MLPMSGTFAQPVFYLMCACVCAGGNVHACVCLTDSEW